MTKVFTTPFAESGDVMFIPLTAPADGSVSYETGFGPDYSADPLEANAKPVPRAGHNALFHDITEAIGDVQYTGFPKWDAAIGNLRGGYPRRATVWHMGDSWQSQVDNNTSEPNQDSLEWLPSAKYQGGGSGGGGSFSLVGPTTIYPGTSNAYTITPYSSFLAYAATATHGTVSIAGSTLTLTIAPGETSEVTDLTVTRSDGAVNDAIRIAIGATSIATPSIVNPTQGSTNIPLGVTLTASEFATYPNGADTHLSTDWRIRTMAGAVVWESLNNLGNKTTIKVPENTLPLSTQLQVDVRYTGNTLPASAWSAPVSFTTTNQVIVTPTITSPANGATNIGATPTFTSSAFATNPAGVDTHKSTDWRLSNAAGVVVWSSGGDTVNKTSITVPTGVLIPNTQYTLDVRYDGNTLPASLWSAPVIFTTALDFIPTVAGTPFGGGYYVGRITPGDGFTYALIVAPKASGENLSGLVMKTSGTSTPGTNSVWNGAANTAAMIAAGAAAHPAANFCKGLSIGGYADWVLPAKNQLELLYRQFKPGVTVNDTASGANSSSDPAGYNYTTGAPAQTAIAAFKAGGSEAFTTGGFNYYWTSTEGSNGKPGWLQRFDDGYQATSINGTGGMVRAVRMIKI